ncbi:MAG: tetratricopeptide repeat protein [bacterium]
MAPHLIDIQQNLGIINGLHSQKQTNEILEKKDYKSLMCEGIKHFKKENYALAVQYFEIVLKKYPDSKPGYKYLGSAYFRNGMYEKALNTLIKAAQLDSADVNTFESLAIVYMKQGNVKQAIETFENILQFHSERNDIREKVEDIIESHKRQ